MATARSFGLGLVAAVAMLVGCADASSTPLGLDGNDAKTGGPTTFFPESVNADQHFADTAVVATTATGKTITVPTAGNEAMIAKLKVGSVIAANRSKAPVADGAESPNPYGFLAKVTAITTSGDKTVLTTERAALQDWIQDGDIDFTDPKSLIDGTVATPVIDATGLETQTLHLQDDSKAKKNVANVAKQLKHPDIELEDPNEKAFSIGFKKVGFDFRSSFSGDASIHSKHVWGVDTHIPTGANVNLHLTMDPKLTATVEAKAEKKFGLKGVTKDVELAKIPLEVGPVPITIEVGIGYVCAASASGAVSVSAWASLALHAEVGFEASAGLTDLPEANNLSKRPTLTPHLGYGGINADQSISAQCTAYVKVGVYLFDAVGISGKVGPQLSLLADSCDGGMSVSARTGFAGEVSADIKFPWTDAVHKEVQLLAISTDLSDPFYLVGTEAKCNKKSATVKEIDSCAGKPDGFNCSDAVDYGGYECEGGQIKQGHQCDMDQKCGGWDGKQIICK